MEYLVDNLDWLQEELEEKVRANPDSRQPYFPGGKAVIANASSQRDRVEALIDLSPRACEECPDGEGLNH